MKKYVYPAIFTPEEKGMYSVNFPDLDGCFTSGEDLADAMFMAEDVLAYSLYDLERDKLPIPAPSGITDFTLSNGQFVNLIACDTLEYQKMHNNRAVKKTLSIPEWMNEIATAAGANFSQLLQDAIRREYNLT